MVLRAMDILTAVDDEWRLGKTGFGADCSHELIFAKEVASEREDLVAGMVEFLRTVPGVTAVEHVDRGAVVIAAAAVPTGRLSAAVRRRWAMVNRQRPAPPLPVADPRRTRHAGCDHGERPAAQRRRGGDPDRVAHEYAAAHRPAARAHRPATGRNSGVARRALGGVAGSHTWAASPWNTAPGTGLLPATPCEGNHMLMPVVGA